MLCCYAGLRSPSFYTRLFKIKDPVTGLPVFSQLQVTLVCETCKEEVQPFILRAKTDS